MTDFSGLEKGGIIGEGRSKRDRLWELWNNLDLTLLDEMKNLESFTFIADAYNLGRWELDFSPLASHENLRKIVTRGYLHDADLSPLGDCTNLGILKMQLSNLASDLSFLTNLQRISSIGLQVHEPRVDFSSIGKCNEVIDVSISCHTHVDASALDECPKLERLRIGPLEKVPWNNWGVSDGRRGQIYGVTLPQISTITYLDLSGNNLTWPFWLTHSLTSIAEISEEEQLDLSQIRDWPSISEIDLSINSLVYIELPSFDRSPTIDLRQNHIIALNPANYNRESPRLRVDNDVLISDNSWKIGSAYWEAYEERPDDVQYNYEFLEWLSDHLEQN